MAQTPLDTDSANVVALPPVIYLSAVLTGVLLKWLLGGSIAAGSGVRLVAGVVLLAAALGMMAWFARALKHTDQDPNPNTPTPSIISEGPFRYTRNPAYVALTAIQVSLALLLDNVWILVTLAPVLAVMHYGVILREEAYLTRKFGDEYLQYKTRVRRWL